MSDQAPSSPSTESNTPRYTPSQTTSFTFSEEREPSRPFAFDHPDSPLPTTSIRSTSLPSDTSGASNTPRYTPSSAPSFRFSEERISSPSFALEQDYDPDTPLPSVERDASSPSISRESTPSSLAYTPSISTRASAPRHGSEHENLNQNLQDLRLSSALPSPAAERSPRPSYQRDTSSAASAPSIHITPTPPTIEPSRSRSGRTDSLIRGVESLRVDHDHPSLQSPDADRLLGTQSPAISGNRESVSRSPSPSRRRRSGSGTERITHLVEDESPPQALFREREVQGALTNARGVMAQMAEVLSSSTLHREQGSNIDSLHKQAIRLGAFQPPSSRIVGLVGDSGVGKSSLINSLLDKEDFARAVRLRYLVLIAAN